MIQFSDDYRMFRMISELGEENVVSVPLTEKEMSRDELLAWGIHPDEILVRNGSK